MNGQWAAEYQGSNTGLVVVDIDLVNDHYEGTACAWDSNPQLASSFVRFRTNDLKPDQNLTVPVFPIDNDGNFMSPTDLATKFPNGVMPTSVNIELKLKNNKLSATWKTDISTWGAVTADLPKTRAGNESDLKSLNIKSWDQFKKFVKALESGRYVFRGQENKKWRLRTSYHRRGRANLERFLGQDVTALAKSLSAMTKHVFDLSNPLQHGAFVSLAQHHGYPTPLLDWSHSPYVSAFFAFRSAPKDIARRSQKRVRIFVFDLRKWNELKQYPKLAQTRPHFSVLDALAIENQRMIPQQAISTMTNVDDIETYIQSVEKLTKVEYLQVIDLPVGQRAEVMRELRQMGITAASMFPGLDGACEELRERMFP